jgi:hypothetical protein
MTTQKANNDKRDEVLYAFHQACEQPTAEQIIEWTRRYPQFADDIRAHAAIARDWAARKGVPYAVPDQTLLARGHSRVLNALYNAEVTVEAAEESHQTFLQMMTVKGTSVPQLARQLEIGRSVLADLVNGCMLPPIGRRLANAFCQALSIRVDDFNGALRSALSAPHLGLAKADDIPMLIPRTYEEIIRSSNMTPERIEYWLSED